MKNGELHGAYNGIRVADSLPGYHVPGQRREYQAVAQGSPRLGGTPFSVWPAGNKVEPHVGTVSQEIVEAFTRWAT